MINKHPILIVTTQPNDANLDGDIFSVWLSSQLDIAGVIAATRCVKIKWLRLQ